MQAILLFRTLINLTLTEQKNRTYVKNNEVNIKADVTIRNLKTKDLQIKILARQSKVKRAKCPYRT